MTICFKCKHLLRAKWRTRCSILLGCGRQPVPLAQSPVTGELEAVDDGATVKGKVYRWCHYVNKGECPDYEAK